MLYTRLQPGQAGTLSLQVCMRPRLEEDWGTGMIAIRRRLRQIWQARQTEPARFKPENPL